MKVYEFDELRDTSEIPSSFYLSDSDKRKVDKWDNSHKSECEYYINPLKIGAIGGRLSYTFIPTGLGDIMIVKCACGAKLDLTNNDNW